MRISIRHLSTCSRLRSPRSAVPIRLRYTHQIAKPLLVLGIESSADDSSASIVSSSRENLSLVTISQHSENSAYGGIHPLVAQSSHNKNVPLAIQRCIRQAGVTIDDIDAIAYTRGPGMRGCLMVGEMAAKGLAAGSGKRLIGVHHMQAHALTPLLTERDPPKFPFLILLVSGGHTQLVLAKSQDQFEILLDTLDSKIGDVFEKAARALNLPHSATKSPGAILEEYATQPPLPPYDTTPLPALPIPLSVGEAVHKRAFSFAGILSSLQRRISQLPTRGTETDVGLTEGDQRDFSRILQQAVVGHLVFKLRQTIEFILNKDLETPGKEKLGGLVVSGGVASNLHLRTQLENMLQEVSGGSGRPRGEGEGGIRLFYPPISLCTDNAAMIAWTAILRLQADSLLNDPYDLPVRPKWSLEDLYDDVQ
ncbi:uncharacterized protein I303_100836 [Kwoniella dejecticola CBS 10117]|uniref:N(6)-L-threonylcarbamoyladenine synthase n=1 Tax=Kwoniella dejecticola CBS 10117 TaxID=1296121 RepID=A0A1A6AG53_9TREE|nr:O-sialoglycoprotein endopeptidase [Kwoniella dejecticola CBS 10117]OBR89016.1 O-sialoglycoprotein endopeptidase [Kwoniella dejecticola CBS 10117]